MYEICFKDANQTDNSGGLWIGKEEDRGQGLGKGEVKGNFDLIYNVFNLKGILFMYTCVIKHKFWWKPENKEKFLKSVFYSKVFKWYKILCTHNIQKHIYVWRKTNQNINFVYLSVMRLWMVFSLLCVFPVFPKYFIINTCIFKLEKIRESIRKILTPS